MFSRLPETTWRLTAGPYTPFYLFTVFCLFAINYNSNWALAQRYYCVRDEREARRVGLLAAGLSILGPPLFFLPAILARDFLPGLEDPNTCYSRVVVTVLPAGMIGVVMAAMFSATMSTLSSEYSVMANVLTTDIYRRLIRRNASDRELVVVGMIMTVVVGLLTMGLGLYLAAQAKDKALFDRMIQVFSIGLGPMAVPFLLGLISRRYGWRAALAGILGGLTVGLSMYVYQLRVFVPSLETLKAAEPILRETRLNTYTGWTTLASIGGTLLFMEIAQRLMGWAPGERERVDAYFARVSRPVERSEVPDVPPEEGPSVFHIVGLSILGAGVMILLAGFAASSDLSRRINLGTGAALAALGLAMWRPWRRRVIV